MRDKLLIDALNRKHHCREDVGEVAISQVSRLLSNVESCSLEVSLVCRSPVLVS
jgi:hypothetical protein